MGLKGIMRMEKWVIRMLFIIAMIWIYIYGYGYYRKWSMLPSDNVSTTASNSSSAGIEDIFN